MTVQSLIDLLNKVEDKSLEVCVSLEETNLWITDVTEHSTGSSGYEVEGEINLEYTE